MADVRFYLVAPCESKQKLYFTEEILPLADMAARLRIEGGATKQRQCHPANFLLGAANKGSSKRPVGQEQTEEAAKGPSLAGPQLGTHWPTVIGSKSDAPPSWKTRPVAARTGP